MLTFEKFINQSCKEVAGKALNVQEGFESLVFCFFLEKIAESWVDWNYNSVVFLFNFQLKQLVSSIFDEEITKLDLQAERMDRRTILTQEKDASAAQEITSFMVKTCRMSYFLTIEHS